MLGDLLGRPLNHPIHVADWKWRARALPKLRSYTPDPIYRIFYPRLRLTLSYMSPYGSGSAE
jgi:hypothetical protein